MNNKAITRFFVVEHAPVIMESIYCKSYEDFQCCSLRHKNTSYIYFRNINISETNQRGLSLFSSKENFDCYYNEFTDLLNKFPIICEKAIMTTDLSLLMDTILQFLSFYRWTEFFYTDESFQLVQNGDSHNALKENLISLSILKNSARTVLNSFFMGEESYLNRMSRRIPTAANIKDLRITDLQHLTDISGLAGKNHLLNFQQDFLDETTDLYKNDLAILLSDNLENNLVYGTAASQGECCGEAFVLSSNFKNYNDISSIINEMPYNSVLISETTSPELVSACYKAIGIVTNQGGIGSHAAIISRELHIPCVVGTGNATSLIHTGDKVKVDGNNGFVMVMSK